MKKAKNKDKINPKKDPRKEKWPPRVHVASKKPKQKV